VEEAREHIVNTMITSLNVQIKKGRTVKYRGKEVQEFDLVEIVHGFRVFKRVYVKYKDGTLNVLSFADFLSRRVDVE
jgi:hypothetical protein